MLLKKLIKNLSKDKHNISIKGLASNSKKVKKNYIFFAINGNKLNGEKYIDEAIKNGAIIIVCAKNCKFKTKNKKIYVIKTSNIRYFLSEISSKFYSLKPKNIIAVTGTNGKTSVADLFYQILSFNKIPVASIGTLGIKFNKKIFKSSLTSPDTIKLHQILEKIKKSGIENVIIEASSHGLDQKRIDHLNLKAGIFTNFSQDHLDYHKTMKSYFNSKLHLFQNILTENKIIICDKSSEKYRFLKKISKKKNLRLIEINKIEERIKNKFHKKFNEFQLKNLSMAISAAKLCNLNEIEILNSLKKIKGVSGRLELVRTFSNNIKVFVDFAHTPDALLKTILSLHKSYSENISIVFGCGGERDKKKRPLMAKIADTYCKKIYVTDDNPRKEKPEKIRKEIIKNLKKTIYFNIGDRAKAIKIAISNAEPNEVILIAGKGHENEQIYKNKIIKISDKQIIKNLKLKIKAKTKKEQTFDQNIKIIEEIQTGTKVKYFHGLAIDTRVLKKNNLFLTIKGKNNDGYKFVPSALKKGAKYIVTAKRKNENKNKTIRTNNERLFLNKFAYKKRNYTNAKIVAITGSAGKTSLKNLINNLLKNFGETLCSPKSYNNHFGVPLSLSYLNSKHKYGIFELGMSKAGEIKKLSKIVRPHVGIITNIGEAHIENFKNLKGIANAKGEMIFNILKGGTLILNHDDKYFTYLEKKAKLMKLKVVSFGINKKANVHPIKISKKKNKRNLSIKVMNKVFRCEIKNLNIYNLLASLALLDVFNLNIENITKHLKKYEPTEGRGKIHNVKRYNKNFKLIDESYNANPLSVRNAINDFNSIKKQNFKKYLLLGDMLELGMKTEALHKDLSKVINSSDIDKVFIKGSKTLDTYRKIIKNKRGNIIQQEEDVDFILNNIIANNDYLMIKGSNATGLHNLSKRIIKGY